MRGRNAVSFVSGRKNDAANSRSRQFSSSVQTTAPADPVDNAAPPRLLDSSTMMLVIGEKERAAQLHCNLSGPCVLRRFGTRLELKECGQNRRQLASPADASARKRMLLCSWPGSVGLVRNDRAFSAYGACRRQKNTVAAKLPCPCRKGCARSRSLCFKPEQLTPSSLRICARRRPRPRRTHHFPNRRYHPRLKQLHARPPNEHAL